MAPSIRISPEAYHGLKTMVAASYSKTISGVINRFLKEEGVMPEKAKHKPKKRGTLKTQRNSFPQKEQNKISNTLGSLRCKYRYQRDAMKAVFFKYNGNKNKTIKAYAWLDKNSYAPRKNNMHDFDSIYYATVLYNDGIKKGWLK